MGSQSGEAGEPHMPSSVFSLQIQGAAEGFQRILSRSDWIPITAQRDLYGNDGDETQPWAGLDTERPGDNLQGSHGCVGVLVTMLWPAMCTERRLTYKNSLPKAQLGPAGLAANFHFTWEAFNFKTSRFESKFLLLIMGLSSMTTAPSTHSFSLG